MKLYRDNLVSLDNFLVILTDLEKVVEHKENTRFEFYNISMAETSGDLEIVNFQESEIYIEDIIGLRELDKNGKLKIKQYDCQHEEYKHPECFLKNFTNQQYSLL
jgi:hypothetical protein